MILMLGVNYKEYSLAYSYDITTSSMRIPSNGSHGLMLAYRLKQIKKDYDKDGVIDEEDECPKIKGSASLKGCPDRDGDGIADKEDECPDDPGLKIYKGCPDRDGDGVIDKKDRCPDVPGIQELDGCPDSDGDGLQDALDRCPNEKGPIENLGCPEAPSIDTLEYVFEHLQFGFNKAILNFHAQNLLTMAGRYLDNHPTMIIKIIGHTDHIGTHLYNMKLSKKRAKAAQKYLVDGGIKKNRLKVDWKGKTEPIKQEKDLATQAPKISKEMTRINWNWQALKIHNWIRGLSPIPGMSTSWNGKRMRVFKTSVIESSENDLPGIVQKRSKNELIISTGKGCLSLTEIQQDGKKRLLIAEFLRGCTVSVGDKFI